MRVYRNLATELYNSTLFPVWYRDGVWYAQDNETKADYQPEAGAIIETGNDFEKIELSIEGPESTTIHFVIEANHYYRLDGHMGNFGLAQWTGISQYTGTVAVFDIMEATYTGKDMGERMITASIKYPTPIDFRIGDFVELSMQSLIRDPGHNRGEVMSPAERFYIYTEPQCKKNARSMSSGDAFEITVTFYPRQFELSGIQMRDIIQQKANADKIFYTGFDSVSFYGGAKELLDRCMACLAQYYKDEHGAPLWSYELAESLDEDKNNALERYAFNFQGNSVMEALMKLNDKDYINTTFFINGRKIYVGFKRPFLCSVNAAGSVTDNPYKMMYGKTSDQAIDLDHGGLFNITKTVGNEIPITKLFAYGAARNLNRYYCADRIKSGRFVNKLMIPSFSDDGETDWIISKDGVKKYGIHEGSKNFEEIYPSLRYITYADIRGIKYCIKVRTSGLNDDIFAEGKMDHSNSLSHLPLTRVQCYKVVPCDGTNGTYVGVNTLVECAPPEDLAVFIHAYGKTVKVILYGDNDPDPATAAANALFRQKIAAGKWTGTDRYRIPTRTHEGTDYIPGSCFCVHDPHFSDAFGVKYEGQEAEEKLTEWFESPFDKTADSGSVYYQDVDEQRPSLHRIEYLDTFWLTDLYVLERDEHDYPLYDDQRHFKRDGYSAWAWPRLNDDSGFSESLYVNEVVDVEPIVIADTSENLNSGRQQHWDIYLRDIGFAIDDQNDFGEMVFVFQTPVVSVLDGVLAGREFTIDGGENLNDFQERIVCAYKEDGTKNPDFFFAGDSGDLGVPSRAFLNGAIWRIRLNRNNQDETLNSVGIVLPNMDIAMKGGNHIVLLDIYMPDIYVRAAEKRLLREAQWYLEKNDKGNVKYAISLDKVRFNQIQNYSMQMREGVCLRMVDADLNITSENTVRDLVKYDIPMETSIPLFSIVTDQSTRRVTSTYTYKNYSIRDIVSYVSGRISLKIPRVDKESDFVILEMYLANNMYLSPANQVAVDDGTMTKWGVSGDCGDTWYNRILRSETVTIKVTEDVYDKSTSKEYTSEGDLVPAISKEYIGFKSGKYYEVVMQVQDDYWSDLHDDIVLSVSAVDTETKFTIDDYECEASAASLDGWRTLTYKFNLPDSFNDMNGYYVALNYYAPDNSGSTKIDYCAVRIVSVTEKDIDAQGNVVDYVDFKVSNVTIKIQDNTRPANISGYVDDMRERAMDVTPEPIYDIQAQIEEQTKASTWGQVMNDLEKTKIETEQNKRTYEMLANVARQNYQNLLNLKNNIFDPDGTCNDVFLQVMMLQIGADSMNYQLDKTFTTPTGVMSNFNVAKKNGAGNQYFMVQDMDQLHHFVYTQGVGNRGTWSIPGNFEAELAPETSTNEQGQTVTTWPTYYVCMRCKKDVANDLSEPAWICSTRQYAVNEAKNTGEDAYWYFNWGILTADSNGNYTLQETRGNAYMYGDNIIAGKISTIAGNSFFDLTHGNFVLSQEGEDEQGHYHDGMTYIDGKLTIYGLNDEEGIGKAIKDLGLEVIGGENLYSGVDPLIVEPVLRFGANTNVVLENGEKYVISIQSASMTGDAITSRLKAYSWKIRSSEELAIVIEGTPSEGRITCVVIGDGGTLDLRAIGNTYTLYGLMVQKGTRATAYNTYYNHLTNALKGSTEVAGGLVMTNLLMLKDENGDVKAGMSGLTDDGDITIAGQQEPVHSEGVTLWSGGDYNTALQQAMGLISELQNILPVLITKTGVNSRIGCFKIVNNHRVDVDSVQGRIQIDASSDSKECGIRIFDVNGNEKIAIIPTDINGYVMPDKTNIEETNIPTGDITVENATWISPDEGEHIYINSGFANDNHINMRYNIQARGRCKYQSGSEGGFKIATFLQKFNDSTQEWEDINELGNIEKRVQLPSTGEFVDIPVTQLVAGYDHVDPKLLEDTSDGSYRIQCRVGPISGNYTEITILGGWNWKMDGYYYPAVAKKTVIGTNGIIVANSRRRYFQILNESSGQKVMMTGLPTSPTNVSGQLYKSGDYLKIV